MLDFKHFKRIMKVIYTLSNTFVAGFIFFCWIKLIVQIISTCIVVQNNPPITWRRVNDNRDFICEWMIHFCDKLNIRDHHLIKVPMGAESSAGSSTASVQIKEYRLLVFIMTDTKQQRSPSQIRKALCCSF